MDIKYYLGYVSPVSEKTEGLTWEKYAMNVEMIWSIRIIWLVRF